MNRRTIYSKNKEAQYNNLLNGVIFRLPPIVNLGTKNAPEYTSLDPFELQLWELYKVMFATATDIIDSSSKTRLWDLYKTTFKINIDIYRAKGFKYREALKLVENMENSVSPTVNT